MFMRFHGISWDFHEISWDVHEISWDVHEISWDFHEISWDFMGLMRFHGISCGHFMAVSGIEW